MELIVSTDSLPVSPDKELLTTQVADAEKILERTE